VSRKICIWGVLRNGDWEPCGKPGVDYIKSDVEFLSPEYRFKCPTIVNGEFWYCAEHWDRNHR